MGEEKLEAGSQGGQTLTFHSLSFGPFWILDHLLTVREQSIGLWKSHTPTPGPI